MKFLKVIFIIIFCLVSSSDIFSQIDSLLLELPKSKNDTNKVNLLNDISNALWKTNYYDSAIIYCEDAIILGKKLGFKNGIANAQNTKGAINLYLGNYLEAIQFFKTSLKIRKEIEDKKGIASSYNNIGNAYVYLGNYPLALKNYFTSLKIKEEIGDLKGIAASYNNIGAIYENQSNFDEAKKNYLSSIKIKEELGDDKGLSSTFINLGNICIYQDTISEALLYFNKALIIKEKLNDIKGVADVYHNIGSAFEKISEVEKALTNYQKAYDIRMEINDKKGLSSSCINLGSLYFSLKNYKRARIFLEAGLSYSLEIGSKERILKNYEALSMLDVKEGNFKNAYHNFYNFKNYQDSVNNEANTQKITEQKMQFEFDKQIATDSIAHSKENEIKEVEISKQKAELKAKQNQQILLYGGLIIVLIFAGFMYNRFKITQKQKLVIEEQKAIVESSHDLLEEKNKEITDSIRYAKRIQNAILPPNKLVKEYLPQSFILYKPKDIVAGDFYWMEHKDSIILFAAADCTGHGVPGAMVSVICNNGLNRSVREHGLTDPAEILNRTREIVIEEFEKSDEEVKDGMDIALCSLEGNILKYAGANNPLWIVRNGELLETKADKQPIGKYAELSPFTTHTFELQKNDSLYIFTDGFHDQFGGDKGKKFKASKMRELILSIQDKTMDEQKNIINTAFEDWKKNLEQVDDVCIIGVKV